MLNKKKIKVTTLVNKNGKIHAIKTLKIKATEIGVLVISSIVSIWMKIVKMNWCVNHSKTCALFKIAV
jgi:hypothetical protein